MAKRNEGEGRKSDGRRNSGKAPKSSSSRGFSSRKPGSRPSKPTRDEDSIGGKKASPRRSSARPTEDDSRSGSSRISSTTRGGRASSARKSGPPRKKGFEENSFGSPRKRSASNRNDGDRAGNGKFYSSDRDGKPAREGKPFRSSRDKDSGTSKRYQSERKDDDRAGKGKFYSSDKDSKFAKGGKPFRSSRDNDSEAPKRYQTDRKDGDRTGKGKFYSSDKGGKPAKGGKSFRSSRSKDSQTPKRFQAESPVQTSQLRLNRYIANSGVCSRREADELIGMGLISVNGKTITEMGYKVNPGDVVRHEDKVLKAERPVYILLNKPKGYLTTTSDPQERKTVMHLVANAVKERVYPVGRLDRNTTGLLLLTNDGDLADKLMHPSYNVKKIYKVELERPFTKADFQKIQEGVELEEGKAMVDDVAIVSQDGKTVGVELHIGWNRVVRRIFEALGYEVVKLDRSVYAGLDKKDLPRGHWRFLKKEEIIRLKHYK